MKILVTGSAGFMGSHLCDYLSLKGHEVYGVDDMSGGFNRNINLQNFTELDLRDRDVTEKYIKELKPDIIFHLAADATEGRSQFTPLSAVDRNIMAYMNLLIPAIKSGVKKVILTSSMSVYGEQQVPFRELMPPKPEDVYGYSKAFMEGVTKVLSDVHGFKYVIIRPHNVYGPRQNLRDPYRNVIGIFLNRLLNEKGFYIYGDGKQERAFSYIDDITEVIAQSAFNEKCEGRIINIGGEEPITLNKLSDLVLGAFGSTLKPKHLKDRPQEVKYAYSNHDVARELLNFRPKTSMVEGLERTVKWAKELGPQKFVYSDLELENEKTPETWTNKLL